MNIKTYSYRYAEEILQHPKYKHIYDQLIYVCQNCPLPVYPGKSTAKTNRNRDVIQQIINTYFKIKFKDLNWDSEQLATPDNKPDFLRSDFRKTFPINSSESFVIQIEAEFGNSASYYRNLIKYQFSYSYDLADLCVLIVPTKSLSKRLDGGVTYYEKAIRELPSAKLSITVPILVIGLDDINVPEWDIKSIGADLNTLKNVSKVHFESHNSIVRNYINSKIGQS